MRPPPDAALAHYSDRQSLVSAGAEVAAQMWSDVDQSRIVESWTSQVPELTAVLSGAQFGAARQADPYLDEVAAWQELDPTTASPVDPRAFAGTASDGRGLMSLLMSPAFSALQAIASGMGSLQAMSLGGQHLDTIARTQVADAGRLADGVSLAAHKGLDGYVRVVVGKTCSRCIVLAGKHYRWNTGFQRHPHCDCIHLPCQIAAAGKLLQDPHKIYQSMSDKQRSAAGWSKADQQALADGADIFQVTNAHKGVYTAGGRKFTTEGTTKHGFAGSRLGVGKGKRTARLTPEQIYAEAGEDRDQALRLLYRHGYLVNEPAVIPRSHLGLAARQASGESAAKAVAAAGPPIRRTLAMQRTTDDIGRAFEFEAEQITGRTIRADFQGSSPATAREHAEGILRGLEHFPEAKLRSVVTFEEDVATYAEAGKGEIAFNLRFASPTGRPRYLRSLHGDSAGWDDADPLSVGWGVRGGGSPAGVGVHEFAHILDIDNLGEAIHPAVNELVSALAAREGIAADTLISRQVSKYATTNGHELIAESFTDVLINGDRASELSRGIFDLLQTEYSRGGGVARMPAMATAQRASRAAGLAGKTVKELRELAKERGIKVPSKALKADIVKLLETGTAPAAPVTGAAKRAAARVRQAEIDRRGQVADLLAEMDELIAKKAEAAVFVQRLDHAIATGVEAATVATLRSAVGDTTKLRAAMTRVGTKNGIKVVGRAGQKVKFDEALHEPVGAAPTAGAQVVVVRRGTTLDLNGETIPLSKARVSTVVAAKPAAIAITPAEARKMMQFAEVVDAMILNNALKPGVGDLILERAARDLGIKAETRDTVMKAAVTGSPEKTRAAMAEAFRASGVKVADAKAGTVVKFDPKIHAVPGRAKIAPGTKVRVAGPGLQIDSGGKTVILSKSRIEPITSTTRTLTPEVQRVSDLTRTAEVSRRPLGGGMTGQVDLVTYHGDQLLVRKELGRRAEDVRSVAEQIDAEELAPMVYQALGVRVPATYRATDRVLYMSHVEGRTGEEILGWGQVPGSDLLNSDQGRMMGLGDFLVQDTDRNQGGFIIDADQNMWSLDHGFAFQRNVEDMVGGPHEFAGHFDGARNDMAPADMTVIRGRLDGLRDEFERAGRLSWWRAMMKRMDRVQRGATGNRSRL